VTWESITRTSVSILSRKCAPTQLSVASTAATIARVTVRFTFAGTLDFIVDVLESPFCDTKGPPFGTASDDRTAKAGFLFTVNILGAFFTCCVHLV